MIFLLVPLVAGFNLFEPIVDSTYGDTKTEVEVALAKLDQHGIPSSWKWGAVHLDAEILGHYWDYALS